jgi:hypothetical protein
MSFNVQVIQRQEGRLNVARQTTTVTSDYIINLIDDIIIQDAAGHTLSMPPNPIPGVAYLVFADAVATTLAGNGNPINGAVSIPIQADQGVALVWEPIGAEWVAGLMLQVSGGGSPVLISPQTQGLVEYDELGNPVAPFTKTFSDQWALETTDATITTLINVDAGHTALFDINGIVLDPGTTTEVVAEINGDQGGTGNGSGYKIMMAWKRNGAGAPIAMFASQLNSIVYGTNAGAPPATWAAGLAGNVPQLALVGPIGGKYYCQPQVQGVAAANIGWGGLFQWRKTVSS